MAGPPKRRAHAIRVAAAAAVAVAVLLSACSRSSYLYVSSSDRKAFFKVPAGWKFFDKREVLVATGRSLSPAISSQFPWLIAYDSDPHPSIGHVFLLESAPNAPIEYPVLQAQVQLLTNFNDRDTMSLRSIRDHVFPVTQLLSSNQADIISEKDVTVDGGGHGIRTVYDVFPNGVGSGPVYRFDQTGIVDPATKTLYFFYIGCESHCFRDNRTLIAQIANSWTVKER
jgi:hypothetical protein